MSKITDYPIEWPFVAEGVKIEAGWRCVRCGHPHERPGQLSSCAVAPIKLNVTLSAKADKVGKLVGFSVSLKSKFSKRDYMSNRQFFNKLILVSAAMLAGMTVSMSGLIALIAPVWAIVRLVSTLPMRAIFGGKVFREPFQAALIATESLAGFARSNRALFAAILAGISHTRFLKVWIAFLRTVDAFRVGRGYSKMGVTDRANQFYFLIVSAASRAMVLLLNNRRWAAKYLLALEASFRDMTGLARKGTESAA